uniref:Uncharacterized protein n=1 Tax=Eutreptiella gymnastica TaxID=73025 RepID=A0A7S1IN03_9EUGL|mmetsp:Transcript_29873/g.53752  ORF Transcript_29873/g.53752 Transcript_29873/m.53752 type:complete len:116 (+) Transcript_29873:77-424(+)
MGGKGMRSEVQPQHSMVDDQGLPSRLVEEVQGPSDRAPAPRQAELPCCSPTNGNTMTERRVICWGDTPNTADLGVDVATDHVAPDNTTHRAILGGSRQLRSIFFPEQHKTWEGRV